MSSYSAGIPSLSSSVSCVVKITVPVSLDSFAITTKSAGGMSLQNRLFVRLLYERKFKVLLVPLIVLLASKYPNSSTSKRSSIVYSRISNLNT